MDAPPTRRFEVIVAVAGWQVATTMPEAPHEYIVRGKSTGGRHALPDDWHDYLVEQIAERGYQGEYDGYTYTYLDVDGFKYWVVGTVINRERLEEPE